MSPSSAHSRLLPALAWSICTVAAMAWFLLYSSTPALILTWGLWVVGIMRMGIARRTLRRHLQAERPELLVKHRVGTLYTLWNRKGLFDAALEAASDDEQSLALAGQLRMWTRSVNAVFVAFVFTNIALIVSGR